MKDTVTLKELFAMVLRHGKRLIVLAVIFALLLGAYRGISLTNSNPTGDRLTQALESYALELEQYQTEKATLEGQLEMANQSLEGQKIYLENSILMNIAPQEKYTTTISLAIEGSTAAQQLSAIQSRYQSLWAATDLGTLTQGTEYAGTEDKYLQEVILLTMAEGGVMQIDVIGQQGAVTKKVADRVYNFLLNNVKTVSAGSYNHRLSLIASATKTTMDPELFETQQKLIETILDYTTQMDTLESNLNAMSEPRMPVEINKGAIATSAVKYAVLGGVIGAVIACIWVILQYLFRNRVETSYQMEQGLKLPFMGSISVPKGFAKLSCKVMGERFWKDEQQAKDYVCAGLQVRATGCSKVLIATTLEATAALQSFAGELTQKGYEVRLVDNAQRNPQFLTAAKECETAILAESAGVSRVGGVCDVAETLQSLNMTPCGFMMY